MFYTFANKGFQVEFKNGYKVSVMFGAGNYCDNYRKDFSTPFQREWKSGDAEIAVIKDGELIKEIPELDITDQVVGWVSPDYVLKVMNWAASQPSE